MSRKEISDALEAINERKNNYRNSAASVNLTDEQEKKIEKAIKERLGNVKNND